MIFLHITQDQEAFQDLLCRTISENNLLTRPFEKSTKSLSISRQLNTLEDTGKLIKLTMTTLNLNQVIS